MQHEVRFGITSTIPKCIKRFCNDSCVIQKYVRTFSKAQIDIRTVVYVIHCNLVPHLQAVSPYCFAHLPSSAKYRLSHRVLQRRPIAKVVHSDALAKRFSSCNLTPHRHHFPFFFVYLEEIWEQTCALFFCRLKITLWISESWRRACVS